MGFIYLFFALIAAITGVVLSKKNALPLWWPLLILLFPPFMFFLISKSNMPRKKIPMISFTIAFMACLSAEFYLYQQKSDKDEDHTPPIIKEVKRLNDKIRQTTIDIYNASGKLDSISMVQSRKTDVKATIDLISDLRNIIIENQKAVDQLVIFIQDHQNFFCAQNLEDILLIKNFYENPNVIQHHDSRANYYVTFERLLKYTHDNFEKIMDQKSQQHQQNYDAYYLYYRKAADRHNRFNRKRIEFQKAFIAAHPAVTPYLPGSHHLEPFKFWDKFSF